MARLLKKVIGDCKIYSLAMEIREMTDDMGRFSNISGVIYFIGLSHDDPIMGLYGV